MALLCTGCALFGLDGQAAIEVSPAEITLCPGQSYQFYALQAGEPAGGAAWTTTAGGVSSSGFYSAPDEPGEYSVMAEPQRGDSRALALVHVVACVDGRPLPPPKPTELPPPAPPTLTPTATLTPTPRKPTPSPTATLPRSPLPTPTVVPALAVCLDPSGDLVRYDTLAPVTATAPGADLARASIDRQGRPVTTLPSELRAEVSDWDAQTSLILWMALYDPVPDTAAPGEPGTEQYWLFALDVDGESLTGRPLGDGAINPDMGVEVTIGVKAAPALGPEPEAYVYIWNAVARTSVRKTEGVEARFSRGRDVVFLRISLDDLAREVRQLSGTEVDWGQAVGRAATLTMTAGGMLADFCPALP